MKNVTFVPKDGQRILSPHKMSEKYNKLKVFFEKASLQACNFVKKRFQHKCFIADIAKL